MIRTFLCFLLGLAAVSAQENLRIVGSGNYALRPGVCSEGREAALGNVGVTNRTDIVSLRGHFEGGGLLQWNPAAFSYMGTVKNAHP